jgi:hypothetical protein
MFKDKLNDNINNIYIILKNTKDIENIKNTFKFLKRNFTSYWNNNLEYIYELGNDNQCLFKHELIDMDETEKYTILMYNDSKQPVYIFPCVNKLSYNESYILEEYKINNRLSLCIKDKSVYFHFKYSSNCDLENNIKNIENCMLKL